MCHKVVFFVLFICISPFSYGQINRTKTWVFGKSLGIQFSKNTVDTFTVSSGFEYSYEGSGIYNSKNGDMIFCADNNSLLDSNFNYIPPKFITGGNASSSQATLITSVDDSILHCFGTNPILGQYGGYTYNSYDIKNAKWNIIGKKLHYPIAECQAHVNHQNGRWQWVVCHSRLGDTLFSYIITDEGLETCPVISHAGPFYNDWYPGQGLIKFSPDGRFVVLTTWSAEKVVLCSCNNQTGVINELFSINQAYPYGIEFSSDKLFVTSGRPQDKIFVYDAKELDSFQLVKSGVELFDTTELDVIGQLQKAPDGNIYIALWEQNRLAYLDAEDNYRFKYTPPLFGTKKCYAGFPNFNASYFHTPALNFSYTRNCADNCFQFTATDTFAANAWQWQFIKNNQSYSGSGKTVNYTFPDSGQWQVRCIASNGSRKDTLKKDILVLKPQPTGFLGKDVLLAAGTGVSGTINGPANMHCLHWQKQGDSIETKTVNFGYTDTGYYICRATNTVFCVFTDTVRVRVCDSFAGAAVIERSGDSLFTKTPAARYQWYLHDSVIAGANTSAIKLKKTGTYKLQTWNSIGCDSLSADYTVQQLGTINWLTQGFGIYPNPNRGSFTLRTEQPVTGMIHITDMSGREMYGRHISGNRKNIEFETSLKTGLYLLQLNGQVLGQVQVME